MGGYPLAGFEVTIIGRFWVTAEDPCISPFILLTVPDLRVLLTHPASQFVVSADQALESCVTVSWNLGIQVHRSRAN
jgi:hypothetical protein